MDKDNKEFKKIKPPFIAKNSHMEAVSYEKEIIEDMNRRFSHNVPDIETKEVIANIGNFMHTLGTHISKYVPDGREKSLALTHLEECFHWAIAGLTRK